MKQASATEDVLLETQITSFKNQPGYYLNLKLILRDCFSNIIDDYCKDIAVDALKSMARMLNGRSKTELTEADIEEKIRNQAFVKQTSVDHIVKIDEPHKWIVFDSGNGHSNHCAGSVHFYLNYINDNDLIESRSRHISTLVHELSHMYGCLHASEGIMSGDHGGGSSDLFYDDLSLSVLNLTHPFIFPSSMLAQIKYKWVSNHLLIVYCEDGIECIVLGSRGIYADVICSEKQLFKYQIDMKTFDQCIAISAKRYVFHVPLRGQSSDFNDSWLS